MAAFSSRNSGVRPYSGNIYADCAGRQGFAADVSTVRQPHQVTSLKDRKPGFPTTQVKDAAKEHFTEVGGRDRSLAGDFRGGGEERCKAFVCRARFERPSRHGESSNQLPEPAEDRVRTVESRASPPGWTLRLRSGQARETPVLPPTYDSPRGYCASCCPRRRVSTRSSRRWWCWLRRRRMPGACRTRLPGATLLRRPHGCSGRLFSLPDSS